MSVEMFGEVNARPLIVSIANIDRTLTNDIRHMENVDILH